MARKNKPTSDEPTGNEWLATYSDTITLLLTFFVLLYSMSSTDVSKAKAVAQAFDVIMKGEKGSSIFEYAMYSGNVPLTGGEIPTETDTINLDLNGDLDMYEEAKENGQLYEIGKENGDLENLTNINENLYQVVNEFVNINELQDDITIIKSDQGVVMQLKDTVLFDTGSAEIKENSYTILDKISELLKDVNKSILIEGHTDNRPINTEKYSSNWELSTSRAVNVVKFLIKNKGLNPTKLSAAGYGEYKPVVENNSEENMSINRRVSILILYSDLHNN